MSGLPDRPTIDVEAARGGWPTPWPNVAELCSVLPSEKWTLVGGLMVQLHTVHHRLGVVRPTNDVDIVLHVERSRGVPAQTANALESIGYRLRAAMDPRDNTAHRFVRGTSTVDLVAGDDEIVDVLLADHPAPTVIEPLRGRNMVRIEGGTQALKRTCQRSHGDHSGHRHRCLGPTPVWRTDFEVRRVHHRLPRPGAAPLRRRSAFGLY